MKTKPTIFEIFAAVLAAANCIAVPFWMGLSQLRPGETWITLFPLPLLYLIEIAVLGILGLVAVFGSDPPSRWRWVPWVAAGILLAFVVLGAWTIGLFLIPGTLLFWIISFSQAIRQNEKTLPYLGAAILAGFIQAVVMLVLVNIW